MFARTALNDSSILYLSIVSRKGELKLRRFHILSENKNILKCVSKKKDSKEISVKLGDIESILFGRSHKYFNKIKKDITN